MVKSIVCICAPSNSGKTSSIKDVSAMLEAKDVPCLFEENTWDIVKIFDYGDNVKVGLSSCGDPGSNDHGINLLAEKGCDIILCASRTRGMTCDAVNSVASKYGYEIIWLSPLYDYGGIDDKFRDGIFNDANAKVLLKLIDRQINIV